MRWFWGTTSLAEIWAWLKNKWNTILEKKDGH